VTSNPFDDDWTTEGWGLENLSNDREGGGDVHADRPQREKTSRREEG